MPTTSRPSTAPTSTCRSVRRQAHVAGGPGADVITVGNGNDTVTGDGSIAVEQADRTVELAPDNASKPHDDLARRCARRRVAQGLGDDERRHCHGRHHWRHRRRRPDRGGPRCRCACPATVASTPSAPPTTARWPTPTGIKAGTTGGSAEKEALYRAHDSVLVGGAGGDILKSGSANDKVFTGSNGRRSARAVTRRPATRRHDRNTVDTGAGSDTVYGSNGARLRHHARRPRRRRPRCSAAPEPTSSPAAWVPTRSTAVRATTTSWPRRRRSAVPARDRRARRRPRRRRPARCGQQHQAARRRHRQRPHLRLRRPVDDLRRHHRRRVRRAVQPGERAAGRDAVSRGTRPTSSSVATASTSSTPAVAATGPTPRVPPTASAATPAPTTSTPATTPTWCSAAAATTRATARPGPTRSTATTAPTPSTAAPAPTGSRATPAPTGSTAAPRPTCCSAAPPRPGRPTAATSSSAPVAPTSSSATTRRATSSPTAPYPTDLGSTDTTLGGADYLVGGDDGDREVRRPRRRHRLRRQRRRPRRGQPRHGPHLGRVRRRRRHRWLLAAGHRPLHRFRAGSTRQR